MVMEIRTGDLSPDDREDFREAALDSMLLPIASDPEAEIEGD